MATSVRHDRSAPTPTVEAMGAAGLRAFGRIAAAWGLSVDEQLRLLGDPPRSTFFAWRKAPEKAKLSRDTLERLSNILGIYQALQILLPQAEVADAWIRQPNIAPPFGGRPALERSMQLEQRRGLFDVDGHQWVYRMQRTADTILLSARSAEARARQGR